jgi:hypothetical protein
MPFADLVRDGKLKKVRAAIDAGAPLDAPDASGFTPAVCSLGQFGVQSVSLAP